MTTVRLVLAAAVTLGLGLKEGKMEVRHENVQYILERRVTDLNAFNLLGVLGS